MRYCVIRTGAVFNKIKYIYSTKKTSNEKVNNLIKNNKKIEKRIKKALKTAKIQEFLEIL